MKKSIQKGFSLIELMVVIAIIGILASAALPAYENYVARSTLAAAVKVVDSYKLGVGGCIQDLGAATNCNHNSYGIPDQIELTDLVDNVATLAVASGVITMTPRNTAGTAADASLQLIWTPQKVKGSYRFQMTGAGCKEANANGGGNTANEKGVSCVHAATP